MTDTTAGNAKNRGLETIPFQIVNQSGLKAPLYIWIQGIIPDTDPVQYVYVSDLTFTFVRSSLTSLRRSRPCRLTPNKLPETSGPDSCDRHRAREFQTASTLDTLPLCDHAEQYYQHEP